MTKPASMAADTGLPDDIAVPPPTLGADMTRRDILKAGAKGAAAVAVPVAALAMPAGAGSEIMRLFREWEATIGAHPPAWASRKESDAFYSATGARQDEISEQMARMEPTTAQELAAIV
ncbi:MAG: hypothetical protein KDA90_23020, partial [Planctomycetaceae bacterium]|nr:hypothetical protein [Planctomycetaceae bacterium]